LKFGSGRAVLTASRADERSWEGAPFRNGYLTHFLITELRQDHGARPFNAVFPAVRKEVSETVMLAHPGATQTPSFEFSERADSIVLGAPEAQ
jgi:hypothetical protein